MKKKEILIDFDGTINDCFKRYYFLHIKICKMLKLNSINYKKFIKLKKDKIKNIDLFEAPLNIKKKYLKIWIKNIEKNNFLKKDKIFIGVKKKLNQLSKKNILYLNSYRCNKKNFYNQIHKFKIEKYFSKIFFISNRRYSSKKEFFKDYKFQNLTIIGDTENDMNIRNNVKKIAVLSGFRSYYFLKKETKNIYLNFKSLKNV